MTLLEVGSMICVALFIAVLIEVQRERRILARSERQNEALRQSARKYAEDIAAEQGEINQWP